MVRPATDVTVGREFAEGPLDMDEVMAKASRDAVIN